MLRKFPASGGEGWVGREWCSPHFPNKKNDNKYIFYLIHSYGCGQVHSLSKKIPNIKYVM